VPFKCCPKFRTTQTWIPYFYLGSMLIFASFLGKPSFCLE
jgi:hypothetical protein